MQHAQEGPIYTSLIFHASLVTEEFSGLGRFPQATTDVFFSMPHHPREFLIPSHFHLYSGPLFLYEV